MNQESAQLIINVADMRCPLCKDTFRTKMTLRLHLKKNHTNIEAENFAKKYNK